ncbi:unnamed protein product [Calicophoron daubneyi]|uniref:LSDAT_euk domain-containing protein n=1 Tax=Calicophoron daubneyi TaxID=300641 RepID=A0AAV2T8F5_CALDB
MVAVCIDIIEVFERVRCQRLGELDAYEVGGSRLSVISDTNVLADARIVGFKECIKFTPDPKTATDGQKPRCFCGEFAENHFATGDLCSSPEGEWSEVTHILHFHPTNAYGQIEFVTGMVGDRRETEFVRISDDDDLRDVMALMEKYWHMMKPRKPSLCISVIGGAKNFSLEGRKRAVFNSGIIQALNTTDAWIVTSGLNLGITRLVGDALQEGQASNVSSDRPANHFRCLGISPWGYVLDREKLINEDHMKDVSYQVSTIIETGRPVSLNPNHTNYIFVDEGRRMRYGGSASAEFRARLENQIALPTRSGGWGIPVVLLIVEGGHDVFIDASNSIRQSVPVVICCGTGRAADILSLAFSFRLKHPEEDFREFSKEERDVLGERVKPVSSAKRVDQAIAMITEIVKDPKLITIFDMNKSSDLDLAILYALIKTNSRITAQLNLALAWDRSDIAETKIFQQGKKIDPNTLYPLMMQALMMNKIEFVEVLLHNDIVLSQFLTLGRLQQLYNKSANRRGLLRCLIKYGVIRPHASSAISNSVVIQRANDNELGRIEDRGDYFLRPARIGDVPKPRRVVVHLCDIGKLLRKMIGRFSQVEYELDTMANNLEESTWDYLREYTLQNPTQELFLWAVLHQRQNMALFFWKCSEDPLTLALIACTLYTEMIKLLPSYDTETQLLYESYVDEFEDLAVRVLEECNNQNPFLTEYVVRSKNHLWGVDNCLDLAANARRRKFISFVACQNCLNFAWTHGINSNNLVSFSCLMCPLLLIPEKFLQFEEKRLTLAQDSAKKDDEWDRARPESILVDDYSDQNHEAVVGKGDEIIINPSGIEEEEEDVEERCAEGVPKLRLKNKLCIFYTAPLVKFMMECPLSSGRV